MKNENLKWKDLRQVKGTFRHWDGSIYGTIILANPNDTEEDWESSLKHWAEFDNSELLSFEVIK